MTTEQLLKPRYKVSEEGYPDMIFNPGQIIVLDKISSEDSRPYWLSPKKGHWYAPFFNKFPSIFQKLEWWEERKLEEMPEYIRLNDITVCKVKKHFVTHYGKPAFMDTATKYDYQYELGQPADKSEFLNPKQTTNG